jgi:hypothetical protein
MIHSTMSNPNHPRLSIGVLLKQAIGCRYDIFIDLKGSGFDVDRYNLTFISSLDLLPNAGVIACLSTLSHIFFTVTALANCHRFALLTTWHFYFSWFQSFCWVVS